MPTRIQVKPGLSTEELQQRYRKSAHPSEKTHWQVLWLVAEGKPAAEVAEATGYTINWVRELVGRYNRGGPEAVLDGRRHHSGRRPLLSAEQEKALAKALEGDAPQGGLWSGPEVARWMGEQLRRPVAPQRGWEYLRKAGQTPQVPRPRHGGADPEAQEAFQAGTPRARSP
ncbi:MAG TPA: winged helix-turn-helix domain-containing protein [Longimicrobiaceae bacterium]|nr:winged helix-turn-helix domain-containing protein [Longimicrobiaceae bacterium]